MDYEELKALVMKAHAYCNDGIPLKDVMDHYQVQQALSMLADMLYATGTPLYTGEEE